jgi:hypothetical protein
MTRDIGLTRLSNFTLFKFEIEIEIHIKDNEKKYKGEILFSSNLSFFN